MAHPPTIPEGLRPLRVGELTCWSTPDGAWAVVPRAVVDQWVATGRTPAPSGSPDTPNHARVDPLGPSPVPSASRPDDASAGDSPDLASTIRTPDDLHALVDTLDDEDDDDDDDDKSSDPHDYLDENDPIHAALLAMLDDDGLGADAAATAPHGGDDAGPGVSRSARVAGPPTHPQAPEAAPASATPAPLSTRPQPEPVAAHTVVPLDDRPVHATPPPVRRATPPASPPAALGALDPTGGPPTPGLGGLAPGPDTWTDEEEEAAPTVVARPPRRARPAPPPRASDPAWSTANIGVLIAGAALFALTLGMWVGGAMERATPPSPQAPTPIAPASRPLPPGPPPEAAVVEPAPAQGPPAAPTPAPAPRDAPEPVRPAPAPASGPTTSVPSTTPRATAPSRAPGWGALDGGDPQRAIASFEAVLRDDPGHRDARYGLGYALLQLGDVAAATGHLCAVASGSDATARDVQGILRVRGLRCGD